MLSHTALIQLVYLHHFSSLASYNPNIMAHSQSIFIITLVPHTVLTPDSSISIQFQCVVLAAVITHTVLTPNGSISIYSPSSSDDSYSSLLPGTWHTFVDTNHTLYSSNSYCTYNSYTQQFFQVTLVTLCPCPHICVHLPLLLRI
jgi:hypothetical protein